MFSNEQGIKRRATGLDVAGSTLSFIVLPTDDKGFIFTSVVSLAVGRFFRSIYLLSQLPHQGDLFSQLMLKLFRYTLMATVGALGLAYLYNVALYSHVASEYEIISSPSGYFSEDFLKAKFPSLLVFLLSKMFTSLSDMFQSNDASSHVAKLPIVSNILMAIAGMITAYFVPPLASTYLTTMLFAALAAGIVRQLANFTFSTGRPQGVQLRDAFVAHIAQALIVAVRYAAFTAAAGFVEPDFATNTLNETGALLSKPRLCRAAIAGLGFFAGVFSKMPQKRGGYKVLPSDLGDTSNTDICARDGEGSVTFEQKAQLEAFINDNEGAGVITFEPDLSLPGNLRAVEQQFSDMVDKHAQEQDRDNYKAWGRILYNSYERTEALRAANLLTR